MSLSASGDLESKLRLARRSDERGDFSSFENLAAHDDDDLESYSSPWNAAESMHSMNPEMMWRRDSGLARRQDVKKCDSNQGGGGGDEGGGEGGQTPNPKPPAPRQVSSLSSCTSHSPNELTRYSHCRGSRCFRGPVIEQARLGRSNGNLIRAQHRSARSSSTPGKY